MMMGNRLPSHDGKITVLRGIYLVVSSEVCSAALHCERCGGVRQAGLPGAAVDEIVLSEPP